ncbi:major royal jelly protein 3-like [Apis laboriosa]|uniref:major royal jelly protein 3-like n=1 Tax=Apis laboriosa TaxID=183418 RepID=UPI001CC594AE|nr:major royal jelly protein 3-like [Apis laboriosa]
MTKWLLLVVCLGIVCQDVTSAAVNHQRKSLNNLANSMNVIYEWKHIDYDFGSEERQQAAIQSGEFDHTKNYPFDVDQWHDKIFVTIERLNGVPSSLNVVTNRKGKGGPLLQPYPNWSFAKYEDCSGIVSAFKIAIDKFDRLWVLDSGLVNNQPMCSPKLVTFDLNTSKLVKQVEIPHNIAVNATTGMGELVSLAVQAIDPTNTMVYIADEKGQGLIIYQNSDDSFHRLTSNTFDYDPRYTKLTVAGESFTVQNGICGIALSPVTNNLYYSPLASHGLYYVNTEQFRKPQYGENNAQYEGSQNILGTQSFAKVVSRNGVLFYGLVGNSGLGCVNEHQVLQRESFDVVAQNEETLQMIVSMKIIQDFPQFRIKELRNEYMLALSNRMQKIINNDFNFNEVNFRILGANVNDLIRNTRCEKPTNQNANNQNDNNQNANNQNANNQNANNQNANNQNDANKQNGHQQNGNYQNDNKQNVNRQNANRQNGNKQNDNRQNDNRQNDNRQNDNRQNDNRQNDNRQNDNRQNDNRQNDDRQNDNRQNDNRQNDNRQNDNRQNDNRQNDNRQNDNKQNANRQNGNKQNDNNPNDNNQNDNQVRHSSKSH